MKNKMRILTALLSVVLLLAGYVLTRYMLFDLHGMKQWPLMLLIIGTVVVVAAWVQKSRLIPLITSAAYTVSFFLVYCFILTQLMPEEPQPTIYGSSGQECIYSLFWSVSSLR